MKFRFYVPQAYEANNPSIPLYREIIDISLVIDDSTFEADSKKYPDL
jgi:hypothetical protein